MTNVTKTYSSMSSAKRGAERAKITNPVFTKLADGRVEVTEAPVVAQRAERVKVSSTMSPVAVFRSIFAEQYGKLSRKDLIAEAVAAGVAPNTAATYYQKLKSDADKVAVAAAPIDQPVMETAEQ